MESRDGTMWLSQERYLTTAALQERIEQFFAAHAEQYPVVVTKYADVLWRNRLPLVQLMEGLPSTLRHYLCDPFVVRDIACYVPVRQEEEEGQEEERPYVCRFDMDFPEYTNKHHAGHAHHANVRRQLRLVLAEERHAVWHQHKVYHVHGLQFMWRDDRHGAGLPDGFYAFRAQLYAYLR